MKTPEEKAKAAQYARAYRVKHKDHINLCDRNRWRLKRRYQRRAKTLGDKRCMFCDGLLSIEIKCTKYCKSCKKDPHVKAYLRNIYTRRWREKKKNGIATELIVLSKQPNRKGRPVAIGIILESY